MTLGFAQAVEDMREGMETLIESGDRANLRILFENPSGLKNLVYLKEYAAIVHIDFLEETNSCHKRFWEPGMPLAQLIKKLRSLKYKLKRLEYGAKDPDLAEWIWSNYSEYAIENLCEQFIREKEKVYGILNGHQADKKGCEPDDMGKIW